MKRWNLDRTPYPIPILAPIMDGRPGVTPDPDDSPAVAAFCDLIAEILIGALQPVEVNSPVSGESVDAKQPEIE